MSVAAETPTAPPPAVAAFPWRRIYGWSVRREVWEGRTLFLVPPLCVAGLAILGMAMSAYDLPRRHIAALALTPAKRAAELAMPYDFAAAAILATGGIVAFFYCLGALHNEKRDRSVLFWKSLPVSDLTTVAAKASIPFLVMPAIALVIAVAGEALMLAVHAVALIAWGFSPAELFRTVSLGGMTIVLLYGVVTLVLWQAPLWGWLLMVGAYAKRAPFLWAVLPPLALSLLELIAFRSGHIFKAVAHRLTGTDAAFSPTVKNPLLMGVGDLDPARFLSQPGLWLGLALAALFLFVAVRLRRLREPV
jgi:ABC-2 type transport system permease protein